MRHIVIPEPITIVDREGQPVLARKNPDDKDLKPFVVSHERFVLEQICDNPALVNGGIKSLRRVKKLADLFEGCKPGDEIAVEDDDYEAVMKLALVSLKWPDAFARFAVQMLPHLEAWEAAREQDVTRRRRLAIAQENSEG